MINDDEVEFKPTGFDYVNPTAKVVLVGITPGNTQLVASREGKSPKEIKRENAFAGGMRNNLVKMLDHIGVNRLLGIETCATLWEKDFDKVEMTSLLKDATFYKGKMFNKALDIFKSPKLASVLRGGFGKDCLLYKNAVLFVSMGDSVGAVLSRLKAEGVVAADIVTIPHPSGANAGRIAVFLGLRPPGKDFASNRAYELSLQATAVINQKARLLRS